MRTATVVTMMATALLLAGCGQRAGSGQGGDEAPALAAPPAGDVSTQDGTKLASFTGDAGRGEVAFASCRSCHSVKAGQKLTGPSLHAIIGRPAGTVAGYDYSPANKRSHIVWSEDKLFQYLENPQRIVPGTKMTYGGMADAQKRADVIAYLRTQR